MARMKDGSNGWQRPSNLGNESDDDLERYLLEGVSLTDLNAMDSTPTAVGGGGTIPAIEPEKNNAQSDLQGALGIFAEAAQDMATASLELSLGRHFACADYCNQVAEKATQAVSLLRFGHRSTYKHDLRALGTQVGAPLKILDNLERLTPFHPEAFYMDTPPEEADDVINSQQASEYILYARTILRWARSHVLGA